jgi:hypothetical protein
MCGEDTFAHAFEHPDTAVVKDSKTIFYVGALWPGATGLARMRALEFLGCRITPFDVTPYLRASGYVIRRLATRHATGPNIERLNQAIMAAARKLERPMDCLWIDKGVWLMPSTLLAIKDATGAIAIHYTPDPHFGFNEPAQRLFWRAIPHYDLLFTTKPFEIGQYRRRGARDVKLVHQSYDEVRLFPRCLTEAERQRFGSEVCFVGQFDAPRARLLAATAETQARLRVWGPAWRRWRWRYSWLRRAFCGDGAFGDEYALALAGTDIGLCFLTKLVPETTTTRTFEIPGCGAFMLAERTDDHLALFAEGIEAEFFAGPSEMVDKIRFYLANPTARRQIAAAGHERALRSGYGNRPRMRELLSFVDALAAEPVGAAV